MKITHKAFTPPPFNICCIYNIDCIVSWLSER